MARVDPDRARRYIDRTNTATWDQARRKVDTAARGRGFHCAMCEDFPAVRRFHQVGTDVAAAIAQAFHGFSPGGLQ